MEMPKEKDDEDKAKNQLSNYNKKQMLNHLKVHGCSAEEVDNSLSNFKVPNECAIEFMQKHIDGAEAHVDQSTSSPCFENIESWLKLFKKNNMPEHSNYEQAMVMHHIANNESHPSPSDFDGVDLKAVYTFLGNAMLGVPQPELDPKSAEFLSTEFEFLVAEANSMAATREVTELKSQLGKRQPPGAGEETPCLSLNPLQLKPAKFDE